MAWFGERDHRKRLLTDAGSRLIADTEAFLSGDFAGHLRRHGDRVPGWAQLNVFAHGDVDALRRAGRPAPASPRKAARSADPSEEPWNCALRVLAGELMELVAGDARLLSQVQRLVLVPLEFELMAEGDLSAFELVQFTRAALRSTTR